MELSFPEAAYAGFLSLFFTVLHFLFLLTQLLFKIDQGKCIKMQGQCRVVFSCTFKKMNGVPNPFRVKTRL